MPDLVPVRSALLSVSDKAGVVEFARGLASFGVRLISTGGTAKVLAEAGLRVTPIEEVTGFPEMMDGRVKTLHPKVHGGLLGLRDAHGEVMRRHGIEAIDLVCINLYPFEATIARPGVSEHDAIENIDIGGPSMIRSASKNFEWVAAVTSAGQYANVLAAMRAGNGATPRGLRAELAREAFAATAAYDAAIAGYMGRAIAPGGPGTSGATAGRAPGAAVGAAGTGSAGTAPVGAELPESLTISLRRTGVLSYGENPHQRAGVYVDEAASGGSASVLRATKHHGKNLSYNNLNDAAAALGLAMTLGGLDAGSRAGAAVVKHTNPCGAAWAESVFGAVVGAMLGDPLAAYGGILAVSREVDDATAKWLTEREVFLEVILAPSFSRGALERLGARWKNVRLLAVGGSEGGAAGRGLQIRVLPGGALVQTVDALSDASGWTHAAGPAPTEHTLRIAAALEPIARALSSNAIAIGGTDPQTPATIRLFGAGAGQMDRVAACRLAVEKAGVLARGAIAFSDAFFPFADGAGILMEAGVTTIVHPGGSKRDGETFDLCNQRGVTCLTTGVRHFRH